MAGKLVEGSADPAQHLEVQPAGRARGNDGIGGTLAAEHGGSGKIGDALPYCCRTAAQFLQLAFRQRDVDLTVSLLDCLGAGHSQVPVAERMRPA